MSDSNQLNRLRSALCRIGNIAGAPRMDYAPEVAYGECMESLELIADVVKKAVTTDKPIEVPKLEAVRLSIELNVWLEAQEVLGALHAPHCYEMECVCAVGDIETQFRKRRREVQQRLEKLQAQPAQEKTE